jgi:hypothetical protein
LSTIVFLSTIQFCTLHSPAAEPGRDRRLLVNVFQSASFAAMVLLLVQLGYLAKREITTFTLAAGGY